MQRLLVLSFCCLLSLDCFAGEPVIQVQCDCKQSDLQLSYVSDAVVYKYDRVNPIEDSVNVFSFRLKIEKPVLVDILGYQFLVLPDDQVRIIITEVNGSKQLKFEGRNSENYAFMLGLKEIPRLDVVSWQFRDTAELVAFKREVNEHYLKTLSYYEKYKTEQKTSEQFNRISRFLLMTSYLQNLIYPIYKYELQQSQLPENYLSELNSEFINQSELMGHRDYVMLLSYYNNYLTPGNGRQYYDTTLVRQRILSYKENFKNDVKADLMMFTFANLVLNGPISLSSTIDRLHSDVLIMFKGNALRLQQVEMLYNRFQILGRKLPDAVLASQLIDVTGKAISLSDVIQTDRMIYIDFWASWCGPCKEEMPASEKLYQKVKVEIPIDFVYISLDKEVSKWKIGIKEIAVSGKHYLVPKDFKSELVRFIGFNSIPRYILIDRNGVLINYDAPRPSEGGKLIQAFKSVQK